MAVSYGVDWAVGDDVPPWYVPHRRRWAGVAEGGGYFEDISAGVDGAGGGRYAAGCAGAAWQAGAVAEPVMDTVMPVDTADARRMCRAPGVSSAQRPADEDVVR